VKITCSYETEPMGTAGPLALAKSILSASETFFVLNSDVICEFPLTDLLNFHKKHGQEGTILVTKVEDPSKYGVVVFEEESGLISSFIEKPKQFISDKINSGIYCFNRKILDRVSLKPTSIEKEVFPKMANDKVLYAMVLPGFWMDVGQPQDFIRGSELLMEFFRRSASSKLATAESYSGVTIVGNVIIHPSAKVGAGCTLGPNVVIGANCKIGDSVCLKNTTVLQNSVVKQSAWISNSIIGWDCTVGKWCRIEGLTVLGEDVQIRDELFLNATKVLPHKSVSESCYERDKIIM